MSKNLCVVLLAMFTACTNNFQANNTVNGHVDVSIPTVEWCKYVPEQYRSYFPDCRTVAHLDKPTVSAKYQFNSSWNYYVRASDPSQSCDGSETTHDACIHGGERRVITTTEISCEGLTASDSLGVFNWTCSLVDGAAKFNSLLKPSKGIQNVISGTAFIPMYVTVTRDGVSKSSYTSVWWTNSIIHLPDNSDPLAASASLASVGAIYVTSTDTYTSGYNIAADHASVVTLDGATIYRNAKTGTDTTIDGAVGSGYRTVVSTGGHKFIWIEGSYDMDDTNTGGEFTVFLSNTKFSRTHLVDSKRGYPVYLYHSDYNTISSTTASHSSDFGITLDGSNFNHVLNSYAHDNSNHYGLAVGNAGDNYVYNFKVDAGFGGIRLWNTTSPNLFDNLLISNVQSGIYVVENTVTNGITNATITNVSANSGIYFDRSDNQTASNILVNNCHTGVGLSIAHNNSVSGLKVVNCDMGIDEYDGNGFALSGEVWLDNIVNCNNSYGGNPGFNTDCAAAGSSTHTLVNSSSNLFGYQL